MNSTGIRYSGHFSIWTTNSLQEHLALVQDVLSDARPLTGWVNGNLYMPTSEVAGVLPIPEDVRVKSGMGPYIASLHSKQRHHYLAFLQGTRKAILPIHSPEEKKLFQELMASNSTFNDRTSGPNWDSAVQIWNDHADLRDDIAYKVRKSSYMPNSIPRTV